MKTLQSAVTQVETAVDGVLSAVPEKLKDMLFEHFEIQGQQVPIRRDEMTAMLDELRQSVQAAIAENRPQHQEPQQGMPQQRLGGGQASTDGFRRWPHPDGTLRMVPVGWMPPTECTVSAMFNLWIVGNSAERISPYCFLSIADFKLQESDAEARDKHKTKCSGRLAKMKGAATLILKRISDPPPTERMLRDMPAAEREAHFERAHAKLIAEAYPTASRAQRVHNRSELSYITVYGKAGKMGLLK